MTSHLSPATIASYIDGQLSQAEFNQANEHMACCNQCVALLANTMRTMTAVGAVIDEHAAPPRRRAVLVALLLALTAMLLLWATTATAQPRTDWTPAIIYTATATADVVSTHRFLANGSGCVEGNQRYWGHDNFTPDRPDTARMWREKAIAIGATAALTWTASRIQKRPLRWLAKGMIYAGAARFGYAAARNVWRCGL